MSTDNQIIIGVSAKSLFDMTESDNIYRTQSLVDYREYQRIHRNHPYPTGAVFNLVLKLCSIKNKDNQTIFKIILIGQDDLDTGYRLVNSVIIYNLNIETLCLSGGNLITPYLNSYDIDLYLSTNAKDIKECLKLGIPAAHLPKPTLTTNSTNTLRIGFDGDSVLFGDESELLNQEYGLDYFTENEFKNKLKPIDKGPLIKLLSKLHYYQSLQNEDQPLPIRTFLITARSLQNSLRIMNTFKHYSCSTDEAIFLNGGNKLQIINNLNLDIYFDDNPNIINYSQDSTLVGHVITGVLNHEHE